MKTQISDKTILKINPDVIWRRNADSTITLMKVEGAEDYFTIDGISADIFSLFDGKRSFGEIKQKIIKKHSPPTAPFNRDALSLAKKLADSGLILMK